MQQKTKAIRLKLDEPPSVNDLYKPVINRNTHQAYMISYPDRQEIQKLRLLGCGKRGQEGR